jgi:mutual gliding-motility protein MglA
VLAALREITRLVVADLKERQPRRSPGMELSSGASELASRISAAADGERSEAPPEDGGGISFARLFPGAGGALAETERAIRERGYGAAVRRAARAVNELLASLPVEDTRAAARAALLGLDGREFLRLSRLAQKPETAATEEDALFALYLLVAACVKAERI